MTTQQQDPRTEAVDYFKRRGRLELLSGLIGAKSMQDHNEEIRKNREAESSAVRKQLWNYDETKEADDMGNQTILGDVTNPTPVVITGGNSGSSLATTLATLALGGLLGGGGLAAGLLLNKAADVPVTPIVDQIDESVSIGLGKIEDYLQK